MQFSSVNKLFEKSFRENWERPALSNYKGVTLNYKDLAENIARMHILFEKCGLVKGDKVAICSQNQAGWGVAFTSAMTFGAVPVPLLHEFKPGNVHHLVNHSEAKVLFASDRVWAGLEIGEMPDLQVVLLVEDFSIAYAANEQITEAKENLDSLFAQKYPEGFTPDCLNYHEDTEDELAMINYTSGTSGFSKGVMIPYRSLYSNVEFARKAEPHMGNTSNVVSMLPSAHMYGMMFEFFFELTVGSHVHFLTKVPSPKIILQAMQEIKPDIVIAVPLIIEKVYRNMLKPIIDKNSFFLKLPVIDQVIMGIMRKKLIEAFGGNFKEVILGGAAFNKEVDEFFHKIKFPYTVGYGMTECAPIISYVTWEKAKVCSCGQPALNTEIKIESEDPRNIAGEVMVKGPNVFLGYYKNQDATDACFTKDGWFRTGDIGVMDEENFLFLRGRSKCMILGPSGQNIYPEEIESVVNNIKYVIDSLVIEDNGALTALVYPDFKMAEDEGISKENLKETIDKLLVVANQELPNYAKIKKVEIMPEDFERTPKKSIKRYLYQRQ
ncbi:MAG: AMP-binding protein [Bacteroidales bacterium]|nr:AMP-binding protein [Bacteroidales bacterium]